MKLKFANLKFREMIEIVIFFMTFPCDAFVKKVSSSFSPRLNLMNLCNSLSKSRNIKKHGIKYFHSFQDFYNELYDTSYP
jgi:hypothetical protein